MVTETDVNFPVHTTVSGVALECYTRKNIREENIPGTKERVKCSVFIFNININIFN